MLDIPSLFAGHVVEHTFVSSGRGARGWILRREASHARVVVYSTNILYRGGSFGPEEVICFLESIQYSLDYHVPFVLFSANAGARIMANPVLAKIVQSEEKHLYIDAAAYQEQKEHLVCTRVSDDQYRIDQIIGFTGCGAGNLDGSAQMARKMMIAARMGLTMSYITSRSVGIGAYLCKIGQRIIHRQDASLVLTGFQAINDRLQSRVYEDNRDLGGAAIMSHNGISQLVVHDDRHAAECIAEWVSHLVVANLPRQMTPCPDLRDRCAAHMEVFQQSSYDVRARHL